MPQQCFSKVFISTFLLVSLTLLIACEPHCDVLEPIVISGDMANLVDKSLHTQEPCAPPCWYGITPGITTDTEALAIVEDLAFIDPDSVDLQKSSRGDGVIIWQTVFPKDQSAAAGIVFDSNGIVSRIMVHRLWYYITLQELIETIGKPDGIMTRPQPGIDYTQGDCAEIDVVWFEYGLEVNVDSVPLSKVDQASSLVGPDLLIYGATYFPPVSNLDEFLTIRDDDSNLDNFVLWKGFD